MLFRSNQRGRDLNGFGIRAGIRRRSLGFRFSLTCGIPSCLCTPFSVLRLPARPVFFSILYQRPAQVKTPALFRAPALPCIRCGTSHSGPLSPVSASKNPQAILKKHPNSAGIVFPVGKFVVQYSRGTRIYNHLKMICTGVKARPVFSKAKPRNFPVHSGFMV